MAHFVSLEHNPPRPEDSIECVHSTNGAAEIGLWGVYDGNTVCTVRVVSGPGTAKAGKIKPNAPVQVWSFSGLNSGSRIQAFSNDRPFTTELEVRNAAGSLADQNKALLNGENEAERAKFGDKFVQAVPLESAIGEYPTIPNFQKMGVVRGLCVHITGGNAGTKADQYKYTFERDKASTHFVIDRDGGIAQYVAASIRAQAQGPGNGHFLSVEMVGGSVGPGGSHCQPMTGRQLHTAQDLWAWIKGQYRIPNRLAWVYSGDEKNIGTIPKKLYRAMAKRLVELGYSNGASDSIPTCINSSGLSCHYWLDNAPKSCPGIGIMGQLPQILGCAVARVEVDGDKEFILHE